MIFLIVICFPCFILHVVVALLMTIGWNWQRPSMRPSQNHRSCWFAPSTHPAICHYATMQESECDRE